jgi:hypothetical protein
MKPETAGCLRKAHEFPVKAHTQLEIMHYSDEAGRAAYLAGLHAAQALILGELARSSSDIAAYKTSCSG